MILFQKERGSRFSAGSTILEAVVALSILAVFIAGAARFIVMHIRLTDKARMHYVAINIAKNQIEQVRNMCRSDFDQALSMVESGVRVDEKGNLDNEGRFRRTTRISSTPQPGLQLMEIEVLVDIINPITLRFGTESEHVKSYMARLLER